MLSTVVVLVVLAALAIAVVVKGGGCYESAVPAAVEIAGGVPVGNPNRYPWLCSLVVRGIPNCGGVLIHPRLVLTANHCGGRVIEYVRIGGDEVRKVIATTYRPEPADYLQIDSSRDIMVLILDKASTKTPIKLARQMPRSGTFVRLLGRGIKSAQNLTKPDVALTKATTVYYDNKTLAAALQREQPPPPTDPARRDIFFKEIKKLIRDASNPLIGGTMFYAPQNACAGDSGGPVFIEKGPGQDELMGIISYVPGYCSETTRLKYSFFVNIPPIVNGLLQAIADADRRFGRKS